MAEAIQIVGLGLLYAEAYCVPGSSSIDSCLGQRTRDGGGMLDFVRPKYLRTLPYSSYRDNVCAHIALKIELLKSKM